MEGRKAKNYVPPLFFEKVGDNERRNSKIIMMCQASDEFQTLGSEDAHTFVFTSFKSIQ